MKSKLPSRAKTSDVGLYIAAFPAGTQRRLKAIRSLIKKVAKEAVEQISYGMPAYKLNGKPLVYFAAYEKHIGLYATPQTHEAFKKELANYKQGKGSVQFPLDEDLPLNLIEAMLRFKLAQAEVRQKPKAPAKAAKTKKQ